MTITLQGLELYKAVLSGYVHNGTDMEEESKSLMGENRDS